MVCHRPFHKFEINRALQLYRKYKSFRTVASITGMSKSSVHRFVSMYGSVYTKKKSSPTYHKRTKEKLASLKHLLGDGKFFTVSEIQSMLPFKRVHNSNILRLLKILRYKYRKATPRMVCCSKEKLDNRTQEFIASISNVHVDNVISLDEVGFISKSYTQRGFFQSRAPEQLIYDAKREKLSCAMAITCRGILTYKTTRESINTSSFLSFFEDVLSKRPVHCNVIVMDNIAFHRSKKIAKLAASHNVRIIHTPPYSPQFNPIELLFASIKRRFKAYIHNNTSFGQAIENSIKESAHEDNTRRFVHCFVHEVKSIQCVSDGG